MSSLPPAKTPLNQHSLLAIETWLDHLGAERSSDDRCKWLWLTSNWSAEISLKQEELRITWEQNGQQSQCGFPYGLPRSDVEAAIVAGP